MIHLKKKSLKNGLLQVMEPDKNIQLWETVLDALLDKEADVLIDQLIKSGSQKNKELNVYNKKMGWVNHSITKKIKKILKDPIVLNRLVEQSRSRLEWHENNESFNDYPFFKGVNLIELCVARDPEWMISLLPLFEKRIMEVYSDPKKSLPSFEEVLKLNPFVQWKNGFFGELGSLDSQCVWMRAEDSMMSQWNKALTHSLYRILFWSEGEYSNRIQTQKHSIYDSTFFKMTNVLRSELKKNDSGKVDFYNAILRQEDQKKIGLSLVRNGHSLNEELKAWIQHYKKQYEDCFWEQTGCVPSPMALVTWYDLNDSTFEDWLLAEGDQTKVPLKFNMFWNVVDSFNVISLKNNQSAVKKTPEGFEWSYMDWMIVLREWDCVIRCAKRGAKVRVDLMKELKEIHDHPMMNQAVREWMRLDENYLNDIKEHYALIECIQYDQLLKPVPDSLSLKKNARL